MQGMSPVTRDNVETFVADVKELISSRFGRNVLAQNAVTLRTDQAFDTVEFVGVDDDELWSFLLGCRLLIQDNERISGFQHLDCLPKSDGHFGMLRCDQCAEMDAERLSRPRSVDCGSRRETLTHREILKAFLYGSYAHLDRIQAERLQQWQTFPAVNYSLKLTFFLVLKVLLQTSGVMSEHVATWLQRERDRV
jgi:hypothetical protein